MNYIIFPVLLGLCASLSFVPFGGEIRPAMGLVIYPFVMIILPVMDVILRPLQTPSEQLVHKMVHHIALALVLPMVAGLIGVALLRLSSGAFQASDAVMMGAAVGMVSGAIGMTAAHELIHKSSKMWRGLGIGILVLVQYGHFRIEHIYGHHIHVGTLKDPATARKGEGFYRFFVRVLITSYTSAMAIEARRLRNRKESVFGLSNRLYHYLFLQGVVIALSYVIAGPLGLLFLAVQTLVALVLTEAVDYIQHYGLLRAVDAAGRAEPVAHHHSWNSRHAAGDWTTFNIGLHSHHHSHARCAYPELSQQPETHEMPANYAVMIFMALLPPLWFHVMDHRLPISHKPLS